MLKTATRKGERMEGKIITLKEFDNVKYLLSKGLKQQEITEIMKIGKGTVSRIANGKHHIQRSTNAVEVCESETQLDRIERKLDSLLKELM